jgi:hypothetical protein
MFRPAYDNSMTRQRESQRTRAMAMAMPYMCQPCGCDKSRLSGVAGLMWAIFAGIVVLGHNLTKANGLTKGRWP